MEGSRTDIINFIFNKFKFESYLEIGVYYPEDNFDKINAKIKHSVDNLVGADDWYTHHMSSDYFFENYAGNQKYDVIFIDALHEENQCYRDIKNSIEHLNKNGFIVIHDCNPLEEKDTMSYQDFFNGNFKGRWNGTVYRAYVRLKNELKDWTCFTVDEECGGCGILTQRKLLPNNPIPFNIDNFCWKDFNENRKKTLQLVSYDEYIHILNNNYYGQFGEDKIIEEYFEKDYIGGCIDIGASNGITINNTKRFEEKGWYCLCVEPNPRYYNELEKNRLHTINYAISDIIGDLKFSVVSLGNNYEDAGSSLKIDHRLLKLFIKYDWHITIKPILVHSITLDYCIEHFYKYDTIDFISIDTEGTELDVLKGFSIEKWNPKLLIVENNFNDSDIEIYLNSFGYKKDKRLEVNDFYIKK